MAKLDDKVEIRRVVSGVPMRNDSPSWGPRSRSQT